MMKRSLDIKIKDSVVDPSGPAGKEIRYKQRGDDYLYKVWIYLEGRDLPYVDHVTYKLHRTFKNHKRRIKRTASNNNCSLVIWTWGIFTVEAEVITRDQEKLYLSHRLSYDQELSGPGLSFKQA